MLIRLWTSFTAWCLSATVALAPVAELPNAAFVIVVVVVSGLVNVVTMGSSVIVPPLTLWIV